MPKVVTLKVSVDPKQKARSDAMLWKKTAENKCIMYMNALKWTVAFSQALDFIPCSLLTLSIIETGLLCLWQIQTTLGWLLNKSYNPEHA